MNDGNQLNPAVRRYIGLYTTATVVVFLILVARDRGSLTPEQWVFAAFLGVAIAVAQQFPIHLTSKTKVYVDTALTVAAALLLPPPLAGLTAALPTAIHEARQRVSWEQGVFNVAQTASYVLAGSWVVHALAGTSQMPALSDVRNCVAVAISLIVMHLVNTMAVAGVVARQLDRTPIQVWRESIWIDLPEHILLVANGVLLAAIGGSYPWLLPLFVGPLVLVYLSLRRSANLRQVSQATIEAIADLTDLLAGESPGHARRVANLTHRLALQLGVPAGEADIAVRAALLHDVGILRADPELMRSGVGGHVPANDAHAQLLDRLRIADAICHQQERWDGSGTPDGQAGEEIPLTARMLAVADVYDHLTASNEPQAGHNRSVAADLMETGSGRDWDPAIVDALTRVLGEEAPSPA